ncbi:MAG: NAD-dependent epimerase/dehydratase family protein [Desulfobacteraceae bacterium]|nr:NAD-dependent epimerase/dehydratase family protein [Desulfobacteraceae bacterium]MCP4349109.1 NAD-dependent epimerase/dehydratase family protein [Desulfobacterales bacterium]
MDKKTPEAIDLKAETSLDPDIRFQHPVSGNPADPEAIFLTGATGFFGVYLLDELLRKTKADIYCLVRCKGEAESGRQRLEQNMSHYSLWREEFASRIIPVPGDLSQPMIGLSDRQFSELGERLDVIYHNGAWVNAIYPYTALKGANVDGTREVLRLAGLARTKPLHFISTIAVFFSESFNGNKRKILETDIPGPNLKGGYKQSKWVAENLVTDARDRGLPACIFRTSRLMGHSKTGIIHNFKDLAINLLKACILMKKCPDLKTTLSLVPADYASQGIVHLSRQEKSAGKAFHIVNPHPVTWERLFEEIRSLGYPLEELPFDCWRSELRRASSGSQRSRLYSVLRFVLNSPNFLADEKPGFDISHTLEGLAGTSIACPRVDRELVAAWFSFFQKCGYIPAPGKEQIKTSEVSETSEV